MALKGKWVNKIDGLDYVEAEDVNILAESIINNETSIAEIQNNLSNYATKQYVLEEIEKAIGSALRGSY